ncbi:Exportin-1/Importin-beta-like [Trinorchestia longiramus]|nr:Exportin-1/Importin-beta-like [Trinorchestia longiramus]
MASFTDLDGNLKEALIETLQNILSPQSAIRQQAEEHIKVLKVTEEFGVHLAEVALDSNGNLPVRQLASVLLQQYVEEHWHDGSQKFQVPECPEQSKQRIRQILPQGLYEPSRKVRSSIAYALSCIGVWDWPDDWPPFFDIIIAAIKSGDDAGTHGAMRVLTEFSRDIDDVAITKVAPIILPEMYNIFCQDQKFSIRTRGRAVEIFTNLANAISMMGELNRNLAKELLYPSLPPFIQAMLKALQTPDGPTVDNGLKKDILKALTVLVTNVPRQMVQYLPDILRFVWHALTASAHAYINSTVNAREEAREATNSDGEVLGFENLVYSLFEFVDALLHHKRHREMVMPGVVDLIYYLILYMQLTEDQIETFNANADAFVEFEDDDSFTYSVRSSATDLLRVSQLFGRSKKNEVVLTIGKKGCAAPEHQGNKVKGRSLQQDLPSVYCSSLVAAVERHVHKADQDRAAGDAAWWKVYEAVLFAVSLSAEALLKEVFCSRVKFDLTNFIEAVVKKSLDPLLPSYLCGKALYCGSELAVVLDAATLDSMLHCVATALQLSSPPVVRISAIRSVSGFCDLFNGNKQRWVQSTLRTLESKEGQPSITPPPAFACEHSGELLRPYLGAIVEGLVVITTQVWGAVVCSVHCGGSCSHHYAGVGALSSVVCIVEGLVVITTQSPSEVMALALERLLLLVGLEPSLSSLYLNRVSSLCLAVFIKTSHDPVLVSLVQDLLQELCQHPANDNAMQAKFFPTLVSLLNASSDRVPSGVHAVALDMLTVLVRCCRGPNKDSLMMHATFPAVVNRTLHTDDLSAQQNGGECLRAFISVAAADVVSWRDADGRSGLDWVVEVCHELLAPTAPDTAAGFVGRLVTALIHKLSQHLGDGLHKLLRGVLSKLQSTETLLVIQNLTVVFGQLVHSQLEDVLNFLSSVPGPEGDSALSFVLTLWCTKQHSFYGSYERKVTVLALAKLLEHGVLTGDPRLQAIDVPGDQIISCERGVRTRSQTAAQPEQWTRVPLLVKFFKLVIYELSHVMEVNMSKDDSPDDEDEEEGWEDDEGDDSDAVYASDLLRDDLRGCDVVDDEDDPDAAADPLFSVQLQPYLTNFIRTFGQHPAYGMFTPHLNPHEKEVLTSIGVRFA